MADRPDRRRAGARGGADLARIGLHRDAAGRLQGDRLTLVGTSGSGKSTVLVRLLRRFPRAVLIDYKGDDPIPDWHHVRGVAELRRDFPARADRVVVQREAYADEVEWFDQVCRYCYRIGGLVVGVDDLPPDLSAGRRSPGLEELYKLGRSRVATIAAVQRAHNVPLVMLSEATHLVVFQLALDEDRKRIEGIVGRYPQPRSKHGFVYARPGSGNPPVECAPIDP